MKKKIKLFTFNDNEKPNKHLDNHPYLHKNFRMILCGVSGSGKTQFLYNLLFTNDFLLKMVKESHVVSFIPSADVVDELGEIAVANNLKHEDFKIYSQWDESKCAFEFGELCKSQTNIFIYDDVSFLKNFSSPNKKNILDEIVCCGRHHNLYNIILSQRYTHLNENLRSNNCSILIFFFGLTGKEIERIYFENFSSFMERDVFNTIIKNHLNEKYKFIIFNKKENKLFNNEFEEIIPE